MKSWLAWWRSGKSKSTCGDDSMGPVEKDERQDEEDGYSLACRILWAIQAKRLAQLENELDHEENLKRTYERFPKVNNR